MKLIYVTACLAVCVLTFSCTKNDFKPVAIQNETQSNAVAATETGILMGSYNGFYLLNADNGATVWHYQPQALTDQLCSSTAAVYNSNVIFHLGDSLYSADIRTGAVNWRVPQSHFRSAIYVGNGKILLGTRFGLRCLNANNGNQLWFFKYAVGEQKQNKNSSPTVANGIAYVCGASDPTLYAVDVNTGTLVWKKTASEYPNYSSPCVYNGMVYIHSDSSALALNAADGTTVWEKNFHAKTGLGNPTVNGGRLYLAFDSLYCVNPANGNRIWSFKDTSAAHNDLYTSVFATDTAVYAGFINIYYKLNAATGAIYSGWGNIVEYINTDFTVSDNRLLIPGVFSGKLYCQNATNDVNIWTKQLGINGRNNVDFGSPVTITTTGKVVYPSVSGLRQ